MPGAFSRIFSRKAMAFAGFMVDTEGSDLIKPRDEFAKFV
jgi:hypothetical protein